MSRRTAAWVAWSAWAVCVVLITLALVLDFTTEELPLDVGGFRYDPGFAVLTGVLSLAYPAVGALIASRLPTNLIGWIFHHGLHVPLGVHALFTEALGAGPLFTDLCGSI